MDKVESYNFNSSAPSKTCDCAMIRTGRSTVPTFVFLASSFIAMFLPKEKLDLAEMSIVQPGYACSCCFLKPNLPPVIMAQRRLNKKCFSVFEESQNVINYLKSNEMLQKCAPLFVGENQVNSPCPNIFCGISSSLFANIFKVHSHIKNSSISVINCVFNISVSKFKNHSYFVLKFVAYFLNPTTIRAIYY